MKKTPDLPGVFKKLLQPLRNSLRLIRLALGLVFDPEQPLFVEAESRKIGKLRVPEPLITTMWQGQCMRLDASLAVVSPE